MSAAPEDAFPDKAVSELLDMLKGDELANLDRKLRVVLSLLAIADRASISWLSGDPEGVVNALADYHSLRREHSVL